MVRGVLDGAMSRLEPSVAGKSRGMPTARWEQRTENLEQRVDRIEQVLPGLATLEALRDTEQHLRAEIKDTEQRLRAEIKDTEQRLRTEITDAEQRTRTHFDVVAESLRDDVRLVAEAVATLAERER